MGMALDESTEGLEKLNSNGINAWIDPQLKTYLSQIGEINIDYVTNEYGSGYMVTVGSVPHPMEEKHYIEWIELIVDGSSYKKFLKPGDKPEAFFEVTGGSVSAREYCNLHGLWSAKAVG